MKKPFNGSVNVLVKPQTDGSREIVDNDDNDNVNDGDYERRTLSEDDEDEYDIDNDNDTVSEILY
jgi:hypothetical protein